VLKEKRIDRESIAKDYARPSAEAFTSCSGGSYHANLHSIAALLPSLLVGSLLIVDSH
jgi:hypothetical protein